MTYEIACKTRVGRNSGFVEVTTEYTFDEKYTESDVDKYRSKAYSTLFRGAAEWIESHPNAVPLSVTLNYDEESKYSPVTRARISLRNIISLTLVFD